MIENNETTNDNLEIVYDDDYNFAIADAISGNPNTECVDESTKISNEQVKIVHEYAWLGQVFEIVKFYEYTIVGYYENDFETNKMTEIKKYGTKVNNKDTHHSYDDYDSAIAGCIAYKYEGCNHRADEYFMKGVKK